MMVKWVYDILIPPSLTSISTSLAWCKQSNHHLLIWPSLRSCTDCMMLLKSAKDPIRIFNLMSDLFKLPASYSQCVAEACVIFIFWSRTKIYFLNSNDLIICFWENYLILPYNNIVRFIKPYRDQVNWISARFYEMDCTIRFLFFITLLLFK